MTRTLVIMLALGPAWMASLQAQPPVPNPAFEAAVDRLLMSYNVFKGYGDATPAAVDTRLSDDRRAVLRAIVRATFTTLTPRGGRQNVIPAGTRLVDYVEAVQGIWGVRPGDSEGKRQFRVSLKFKPGIRAVMDAAREFHGRIFCHVLLAQAKGGDDDPAFPAGQFRWAPKSSCKWSNTRPELQVNYSNADETVGEMDLDFDEGANHFTPANSDPRSYDASGQEPRHIDELNRVHNYIAQPLMLKLLDQPGAWPGSLCR